MTISDSIARISESEGSRQGRAEIRGKILQLESALLSMPQIDIPILHHFAPGLYLREMRMPKGALITGKIHKTEHLCILSSGDVSVSTEDGPTRYRASSVIHSMPGVKRALYAHEDSTWINVHHNPSDERDPDAIERIYVVESYDQFLAFMEEKKLIEGGK